VKARSSSAEAIARDPDAFASTAGEGSSASRHRTGSGCRRSKRLSIWGSRSGRSTWWSLGRLRTCQACPSTSGQADSGGSAEKLDEWLAAYRNWEVSRGRRPGM
jgi:hypothetical protein